MLWASCHNGILAVLGGRVNPANPLSLPAPRLGGGGTVTIKRLVQQLPRFALDLLFPLQCLGCQREGKLLCESCEEQLPRLESPYCLVCAQPNAQMNCRWCQQSPLSIDGIRAPYLMQGPIREGIHSLKYRGVRAGLQSVGAAGQGDGRTVRPRCTRKAAGQDEELATTSGRDQRTTA